MCRLAAAWADGVVPLGQNVVRFELQSLKLFRTGFGASGVMSAVQIGRNGQAGCRRGRTDKVKDLLVAMRGSPAQFLEISEKSRCSMGFHLEAPVG